MYLEKTYELKFTRLRQLKKTRVRDRDLIKIKNYRMLKPTNKTSQLKKKNWLPQPQLPAARNRHVLQPNHLLSSVPDSTTASDHNKIRSQWSSLVPLIGGIYCQLGDYRTPIPPIKGTIGNSYWRLVQQTHPELLWVGFFDSKSFPLQFRPIKIGGYFGKHIYLKNLGWFSKWESAICKISAKYFSLGPVKLNVQSVEELRVRWPVKHL